MTEVASAAMILFAAVLLSTIHGLAQSAPPFVVTSQTTLASYTLPIQVNGNSLLQGAGFGTLAINKFGDVFVGGYNSNTVYEFPASGATPVAVYNSSTGGHAGAVAIDPNQNLFVSERFQDFVYMIPYFNGGYTAFTYSSSQAPSECASATPTSSAACNYDEYLLQYENSIKGSVTGYYYQPMALAFDAAGNSYVATSYDSNGSDDIIICSVACNYNNASFTTNPAILLHHHVVNNLATQILSLAVDSAGDVFFVDGSGTLYEVTAASTKNGTATAATATVFSSAFIAAQGVGLDPAGNLYVSDNGTSTSSGTVNGGIYEIPLENGVLNLADMYLVVPLDVVSQCTEGATTVPCSYSGYDSPADVSLIGVAVDQHGNIFQTEDYDNLFKYTVGNASLPSTALGKTSAATTLTVVFNRAITLKSTSIAAAGVASAEFALPSTTATGACALGTAYKAGDYCTFAVTFTPQSSGLRQAVLTLTDTAGDAIPVSLSGTGVGQAITVDPGTVSALSSSLSSPDAITVDAAGNVFIANSGTNAVYEYAQGAGAGVAVGSGLKQPGGVATDAAGNLYISDTGNDRVVMVPNNGGVLSTASQSTLISDLKAPGQLAVDANGTLYIPETGNKDVISWVSRSALGSAFTATAASGLSSPAAVAVDASGHLYVADTGNNRVLELFDGVTNDVGSGFSAPTGVTVDASGSVLVADNGNGRIVRIPNIDGVLTSSGQTAVTSSSAIISPYALQLNAVGDLYATDSANGAAYAIDRTTGAVNFGKVNVKGGAGNVEAAAFIASSGTADLALDSPLYTAPAAPFSVSGDCSGTTLASGSSCALDTYFQPVQQPGVFNYQATVSFATKAQNTTAAALDLSGTSEDVVQSNVALAQTVPSSGDAHYGSSVTVQATITSTTGSGPTPTGTVIFSVDGSGGKAQTLNSSGSVSFVLSNLAGGDHSVVAQYSGDDYYGPADSSSLAIHILPGSSTTALSIVACVSNPLSARPANTANSCDTVTMTATVVPSVTGAPTGPVVFSSGGTNLGSAALVGSSVGSATVYQAVLSTTKIPLGTYHVVATYSGDTDYATSVSSATTLVITEPKFTLSANTTGLTSSSSSFSSATISVTSYSDFTGAVDFSCSGLPANAYCKFLPAVVSLVSATSGLNNVPALTTVLEVQVNQPPVVTPTGFPWWSGILLGLLLLGSASSRKARRRLLTRAVAGCVLLAAVAGMTSCSSSVSAYKTPSGTSTVTVTAVASPTGATTGASDVSSTLAFTLTVK
jgi:sugar lactone lactonase YvrE